MGLWYGILGLAGYELERWSKLVLFPQAKAESALMLRKQWAI
jgi:hypothetical protein